MGKIEEAVNPADILDDPEKLKEAGNDFFKKSEWDSALDCYTQAIKKTKGDCEKQKAIYFKNRAACYLKMDRFEDAVDDCTKSLELTSYSTLLCKKVYDSSQWESCFLNVLCSQDFDIVYRGVVAVGNMIEGGKEVAEPMMDTKVLDVCQALIIKAKMDGSNYQPNPTLQKIKLVAEVALQKAHEMGIIKTYDQAVQEYEDDDKLEEWRSHPKPIEDDSSN